MRASDRPIRVYADTWYNAVNVLQGYGPLAIHAPPEVLFTQEPETDDEDEEAL